MTLLDAKDLSVRLNQKTIVRDIDFHVARGEVVGLIGPNGAGKSTLLKAMAGLLDSESQSLAIGGREVQTLSSRELARLRSYLAQDGTVQWPLQVERVVALGRFPHGGGASAEDQAAIGKAMEKTAVTQLMGRAMHELSGGEAMRVVLARLFAVEADLLLLDEPIQGLDPGFQLQVMQLLRGEAEQHRGVVAVLHDLSLAARYCDRLVLLHAGSIYAEGPPAEVLTEQALVEVYHVQGECDFSGDMPWIRLRHSSVKSA